MPSTHCNVTSTHPAKLEEEEAVQNNKKNNSMKTSNITNDSRANTVAHTMVAG
jgi:hypothetical protein